MDLVITMVIVLIAFCWLRMKIEDVVKRSADRMYLRKRKHAVKRVENNAIIRSRLTNAGKSWRYLDDGRCIPVEEQQ